ncbi:MAG: class I SAM-dependent methyltransferase [bacterium]|nr:class I SAM-dependent methyltransferase [bacterium]
MSVGAFYRDFANYYPLLFRDWDASIREYGDALDTLIRREWGGDMREILDVTCGPGTQAIGLALLGHRVTGSDLSPEQLELARTKAAEMGATLDLSLADVREVYDHHQRTFDVVLSCGNSLPHLLTDDDLLAALTQMHACTRPGGGCIVAIRDYANEDLTQPLMKPFGVRERDGKRYVLFQVWTCTGELLDVDIHVVEDTGGSACPCHVLRTQVYPVHADRLTDLMRRAGFADVRATECGCIRPVLLVGTRPA